MKKYVRIFTTLIQKEHHSKTRHFLGFPPELTGGKDYRKPLPWPSILVIEETKEGLFLYRYDERGKFGGDTWHQSLEDAKQQAKHEYGKSLGDWKEIPEDVADVIGFITKNISNNGK